MRGWVIVYEDGSVFSNEDGDPWLAPRAGVMVVLREDEKVDVLAEESGAGYWVWKDDTWVGVDEGGVWDYRYHHMEQPHVVIYGRMLKDEKWEGEIRALIEAHTDRAKHSWRKRERRIR